MTTRYNRSMSRSQDIKPNKTYNLPDLMRMNVFWWIKDRRQYQRIFELDAKYLNLLQVEITGEGRGKRYLVKGRNIIKFFRKYEYGINLLNEYDGNKRGKNPH